MFFSEKTPGGALVEPVHAFSDIHTIEDIARDFERGKSVSWYVPMNTPSQRIRRISVTLSIVTQRLSE